MNYATMLTKALNDAKILGESLYIVEITPGYFAISFVSSRAVARVDPCGCFALVGQPNEPCDKHNRYDIPSV